LESEIVAKRKEAEKRENILTDHIKERSEDLNKLEEEFNQQERRLEEEIISLKIQLEEEKRTEEVMKIQMMKKDEEVENLEEEVVTLRVKIVKLNKNFEDRETSTSSVKKFEEKHSRLSERKNEEKRKSYAEVIKRRNHGNQESKNNEYNRDTSSKRPSTFKQKIICNHDEGINRREDHDQPRKEFRRTTPQRTTFTPRYENFFYGHCFICTNFGHKAVDCRAYGRNVHTRNTYVDPHNIECHKCHNYGPIAQNCRIMINPTMK
jgi:hypothetical protein